MMDSFINSEIDQYRIFSLGDGDLMRYAYSDDGGDTWIQAAGDTETQCNSRFQVGNGAIVSYFRKRLCYSDDNAESWNTSISVGRNVRSLVWDGKKFIVYTELHHITPTKISPDGVNWMDGPTVTLPDDTLCLGRLFSALLQ